MIFGIVRLFFLFIMTAAVMTAPLYFGTIVSAIRKKKADKYFNVKARLHYCDEKCGCGYYDDCWPWDDCQCGKLKCSIGEIKILVYKNKLIGMKDFESYVQECVNAFSHNCDQIKELRKRQSVRYCTNREEVKQKISELKKNNEMILKQVGEFKEKVEELALAVKKRAEELAWANGPMAKMDDIVVEGDKQTAMLNECTSIMERVLAEFEVQKKEEG